METVTVFVSLNDAARYEERSYQALKKRVQRGKYVIRTTPRSSGGQPVVEIALTSLSPAAQERYWREHSGPVVDAVISDRACGEPPWYRTMNNIIRYMSDSGETRITADMVAEMSLKSLF